MFPWHKKVCGCKHNLRLRDFLAYTILNKSIDLRSIVIDLFTPRLISANVPIVQVCCSTRQIHAGHFFSWSVLGGRQKWPWKFTFSPYYTMIMMQPRTKNHVILQEIHTHSISMALLTDETNSQFLSMIGFRWNRFDCCMKNGHVNRLRCPKICALKCAKHLFVRRNVCDAESKTRNHRLSINKSKKWEPR